MRIGRSRLRSPAAAGTLIACLALTAVAGPSPADEPTQRFGGDYADLAPVQRRLVDEWFHAHNLITGGQLEAAGSYDALPLSTRTTFEAVTHALMTSKLTGEDGRSLGTALDLVDVIETARGKVPGASGDYQFRVYVYLQPDAVETLEAAREFRRGPDNTFFHGGYPLNYRQQGGAPSIQYSVSEDRRHADIDVDYRSSKFPWALFSGHLTSANSDVRAGGNYDRHVGRWEGLVGWWRNLLSLGLPVDDSELGVFPDDFIPIAGKAEGEVQDAVADFLDSWLVEAQPRRAAAYLSERAYACLAVLDRDDPAELGEHFALYRIVDSMTRISAVLGPSSDLADVFVTAPIDDPRADHVRHDRHREFYLAQVNPEMAREFECHDPDNAPAPSWFDHGEQYVASTRLRSGRLGNDPLRMLWAKEGPEWKLAAWTFDHHAAHATVPAVRSPQVPPAIESTAFDADEAELAAVADAFLVTWFVEHDIDGALAAFAPEAHACVDLHAGDSDAGALERIRSGLTLLTDEVGQVDLLAEAVRAVEIRHPDLHLVPHPHADSYTLARIPETMAFDWDCADSGGTAAHYGLALRLRHAPGHAGVIHLLWSRTEADWRIVAFEIATP